MTKYLSQTFVFSLHVQHELVGLELTDTVHCDDVMVELNLSPEDLLVPVPAYVRRDRLPIIQEVILGSGVVTHICVDNPLPSHFQIRIMTLDITNSLLMWWFITTEECLDR